MITDCTTTKTKRYLATISTKHPVFERHFFQLLTHIALTLFVDSHVVINEVVRLVEVIHVLAIHVLNQLSRHFDFRLGLTRYPFAFCYFSEKRV